MHSWEGSNLGTSFVTCLQVRRGSMSHCSRGLSTTTVHCSRGLSTTTVFTLSWHWTGPSLTP